MLKSAFKLPIKGYQYFISPLLGSNCRFSPSCSHYGLQALDVHGVFYGIFLIIKRLLKCHPWGPEGHDPVPLSCHSNCVKDPES